MVSSVTAAHDEFIHYTTGVGLKGILTSGSLWATHSSFLNDSSDTTHFFEGRILEVVEGALKSWLQSEERNAELLAQIELSGGLDAVAAKESSAIAGSMRRATEKYNEPYIFSMSAPRDSYTRINGLLSQWRAYGSGGGYGVVLDANPFEELLRKEVAEFEYSVLQWGDVFYSGRDFSQPASEDVAHAESVLAASVKAFLDGRWPEGASDTYHAITTLSCFYKHGAFYEESEVRVLAIPAPTDEEEGKAAPRAKRKPRLFRSRDGLLIPYLELLGAPGPGGAATLPIRRVIVGPHNDRRLRKQSVEMLLKECGYDVEVLVSDIPYTDR